MIEWVIFLLQEYGSYFLKGTWNTLTTAVLGTMLGFGLGFLIGMMESTPVSSDEGAAKKGAWFGIKSLCKLFVELFRDTPMMVQAMVIYYGLKQYQVDITPYTAAVLVIMLNTGAYMAETVRGGILSIDPGQREGGMALGMSHFMIMFSVMLPQAFRNILPEMGNLFITNLKMTSVLNVIGISELYFITKTAANTYYRYFEAFLITGLIYLVLCLIFSRLFAWVEKWVEGSSSYELATEYME